MRVNINASNRNHVLPHRKYKKKRKKPAVSRIATTTINFLFYVLTKSYKAIVTILIRKFEWSIFSGELF